MAPLAKQERCSSSNGVLSKVKVNFGQVKRQWERLVKMLFDCLGEYLSHQAQDPRFVSVQQTSCQVKPYDAPS